MKKDKTVEYLVHCAGRRTMSTPKKPGWYWFLPNAECPTKTGLLRVDKPVVILVGAEKQTRDGPPGKLVVRFSTGPIFVDELKGDWEECPTPKRLSDIARKRWIKH